ncbi:BCCT family transporter [Shewanella woodyi]|uniref:BCCT family transporter n=1 Tax=Shewanella woodyi TaxID=60961 RepID=UPI00374A3214
MNRKLEHLNTSPAPIKHRISKEKVGFISCLLLAATFLLFPGTAVSFAASISDYAIKEYGLGFIVFPSLLVILSLLIAFTPFGKVRLGGGMRNLSLVLLAGPPCYLLRVWVLV